MAAVVTVQTMQYPAPNWLTALRRYLAFAAVAHLVWEIGHVPLYTIWRTGTVGEILFAVLHCTGGDLLITLSTLALSLLVFGCAGWPGMSHRPVLLATIALGVGYTIFSEWLNVSVREAWAYREIMPVLPFLETGLSPVLQWIVVPALGYSWAVRWPWWRRQLETAQ